MPEYMEKCWNVNERGDENLIKELESSLEVPSLVASLLVQRDISTPKLAYAFFDSRLEHLHDPFLMKDMDVAVGRLMTALRNGEKIMIYGDYDVDGTTSVALVYSFLRRFHANLEFYIPDRYKEGYGISSEGIEAAADAGCRLIISLDCGIKAVNKVAYAQKFGIDFIICDHHTPGEVLPPAVACLDPRREDCPYPYKELTGCGVGFKFMQAFCRHNHYPETELYAYLDLVAVSIASDIALLSGENRIMALYGLEKLNTAPRVGLHSIIRDAHMEHKKFEISDIVFKIGPRINAAGRIESGRDAVELLISEDEELARMMSSNIGVQNNTRKDLDRLTTQEALEMLAGSPDLQKRCATVLFKADWHKGVIGIVASRLTDHYYRPTVILTESQGLVTGSARSVDGFDLYAAVESCSDLLVTFGGHMYAVGLTMKHENLPAFQARFESWVKAHIQPVQQVPRLDIDAEIKLKDINSAFNGWLKRMQPFGPGNPKPLFVTRRVFDYGTSKVVGREREHLKLELIEECSGAILQGVAFGMGRHLQAIKSGQPFDVVYALEETVVHGKSMLQLMVRDLDFPYGDEHFDYLD